MSLVPALCSFGPIEMVFGYNTPYHFVAILAALFTSIGILIVFANVMQLLNASEPKARDADAERTPAWLVGGAIFGALIIAAVAALLYLRGPN